ncbi:SRPBCC family protein [Aquihabitans daechungensis]|uniref:SRPBCC family protein n=1 Tax=Aquihabitans daechungensis TaxID=1052257 RepID=UPI003BA1E563
MDIEAELRAPCTPDVLFAWARDLDRYPQWLEIVTQAQPGDDGSWAVDLRGRMGPLARTKRLRMVRTELVEPSRVVFERAEVDGREHSPWTLTADVSAEGDGARLAMSLHYGGGLFEPLIERVLRDEIERSRLRLLELVTTDAG